MKRQRRTKIAEAALLGGCYRRVDDLTFVVE